MIMIDAIYTYLYPIQLARLKIRCYTMQNIHKYIENLYGMLYMAREFQADLQSKVSVNLCKAISFK